MLEKWKSAAADKGKLFGDYFSHDILLAKLHAYGFNISALKLIRSYLKNRKQRTKIDLTYSSWKEILYGVSQEPILGPLLFNISLYDPFCSVNETDFTSYVDDMMLLMCY